MSNLHFQSLDKNQLEQDFGVTENTAMYVPENTPDGEYKLSVSVLDAVTLESKLLDIKPVKITIDNSLSTVKNKRELDLVSEISQFAPKLGEGIAGLESVFAEVARINQYDPNQAYLQVTEKALQHRLQQEDNVDYVYTILLSQVLQQKVNPAINTAQILKSIAPENAYSYAYLSFLYLYDWKAGRAELALQPALTIAPEVVEFQYLDGITALLQGKVWKAWRIVKETGIL